jgi:DNA invertase Pin-like site-specific DNA recombinase
MVSYGYLRIGRRNQSYEQQKQELKEAGCEVIFREKFSGVTAHRPQLVRLMRALQPGDRVVVARLNRLGRSTRELLELIDYVAQRGAHFKSLGDPLFDTSASTGPLLSALLGAIAEFERDLISERTGAGRERARKRGVRFGRKPKMTEHQIGEAIGRLAQGEPQIDLARSYNMSKASMSRFAKKFEAEIAAARLTSIT